MYIYILILILLIILLVVYQLKNDETIHQIVYPDYYKDKFLEDEFPPVVNEDDYYRRVAEGYNIMENKKIVILGLVYNLGEKTHTLMKRLSYLVKNWKDYRIILYAKDSTDSTFEILQSYTDSEEKIILPEEKINKKGLNRIQKMSKLRNILLLNLKNLHTLTNFTPDYVLMQDCDMASALSLDGLAHSITYKYDAIFANGIVNEFLLDFHIPYIGYFYYDSFAYVEDPNNDNNPIINKMALRRGEEPLSVISAFGGAGLYKYSAIKNFHYDENKLHECEHVTLHKKMYKAGFKLAINPSLLLLSGRQGEFFKKG